MKLTEMGHFESNDELREAINLIWSGAFYLDGRELFKPLLDSFISRNEFMLLADFESYIKCQTR